MDFGPMEILDYESNYSNFSVVFLYELFDGLVT